MLEEEGVELSDEQKSMVGEITDDLTSNLERIQSHGQRANRIVENMLRMGRGSGDWQTADINGLLEEHARLAYHSARATDSDFQLDIKDEYDPAMGEMEVIPQDLGRVFLNMVSNACYATNERRVATPGAGTAGGPYSPTIWLKTKREEDHVEVRIRDNGMGMPQEVIEKIFNPFFTTKPTDQGTGLGLSLSSDIVRRHGGTIRVDSAAGRIHRDDRRATAGEARGNDSGGGRRGSRLGPQVRPTVHQRRGRGQPRHRRARFLASAFTNRISAVTSRASMRCASARYMES